MNAPIIPPLSNEDRLPHEKAVWRPYLHDADAPADPPPGTGERQVSIDYGGGHIKETWAHLCYWRGVKRWRFGWPPSPRNPFEGLGLAAKE